jgi:hypothetical protein
MAIVDDVSIDYTNLNLRYIGTLTNSIPDTQYSVNELYSFLQDTFDEPGQMDNPVPMSAQTPTEYSLINGWFMDDESVKAFYGGAIQSNGWASGVVRQFTYDASGAGVPFTSTMIGLTLVRGTDDGVILAYDTKTGTDTGVVWVRPVSTGDTFATTGAYTVTTSTASGNMLAASQTGEAIWANIFTLGTVSGDTEIYIGQVNDYSGSPDSPAALRNITQWWDSDVTFGGNVDAGHVDLLLKIQEVDTLIDSGIVAPNARQFTETYDFFPITLAGGRNAVPISMGDDLNNPTGYRTAVTGAFTSGPFTAGEVISQSTVGFKGILTDQVADTSVEFYLVGKDLTALSSGVAFQGEDSGAQATASSIADTTNGPAEAQGMSFTFGFTNQDINNGAGSRPYSVIFDVNSNPLDEAYERAKYVTRRGETATLNGQEGQFYRGIGTLGFNYDTASIDPPFNEAETVTSTGGFSGVITSRHDTGVNVGYIVVRSARGTLANNDVLTGSVTGHTVAVNGAPETIAEVKQAPFGSFAGGVFFGARGVFLDNVAGADVQNYQLIDTFGTVQVPPNAVGITITGLSANDRGTVFRSTGNDILKDQFNMTAQAASATTITVSTTIAEDNPVTGIVRVVDASASAEHRYRYDTFSGAVFTLSTGAAGSATSTGLVTLTDTAADFGGADDVQIGDLVRNITDNSYGEVVAVNSTNVLTHSALVGGTNNFWTATDTYETNQTVVAYTTSDDAYAPLVDGVSSTGGDLVATITYSADIPVIARVRQSSTGESIIPFEQPNTVRNSGLTVTAIRNPDTIAS